MSDLVLLVVAGSYLLTVGGLLFVFGHVFNAQRHDIQNLIDRIQAPPELSAMSASRRLARSEAAQARHPSAQTDPDEPSKPKKSRQTLFGIPTSEIDPDDYMGDSS